MKPFDEWNGEKKLVDKEPARTPKHRWLWWAILGVNVGHEQDGGDRFGRPVLVLRVYNNATCLVVPLTRAPHKGEYVFDLSKAGYHSLILLDQMRVISTRRLRRAIVRLDDATFAEVMKVLCVRNGFDAP